MWCVYVCECKYKNISFVPSPYAAISKRSFAHTRARIFRRRMQLSMSLTERFFGILTADVVVEVLYILQQSKEFDVHSERRRKNNNNNNRRTILNLNDHFRLNEEVSKQANEMNHSISHLNGGKIAHGINHNSFCFFFFLLSISKMSLDKLFNVFAMIEIKREFEIRKHSRISKDKLFFIGINYSNEISDWCSKWKRNGKLINVWNFYWYWHFSQSWSSFSCSLDRRILST